jgi:hypothetical protein
LQTSREKTSPPGEPLLDDALACWLHQAARLWGPPDVDEDDEDEEEVELEEVVEVAPAPPVDELDEDAVVDVPPVPPVWVVWLPLLLPQAAASRAAGTSRPKRRNNPSIEHLLVVDKNLAGAPKR